MWELVNEQFSDDDALDRWLSPEVEWGLFGNREVDLGALGEVSGRGVLDLACGTGYFSAWLARLGARPLGVDLSPAQLGTAQRCQAATGVRFPLVEADAEHLPFPDRSFDLVVSEYGTAVWCEPGRWVAEASRVLRPGGRLVFLTHSPLVSLCVPSEAGSAEPILHRPQRGSSRVQWPEGGVEFHPGHGEWVEVLTEHGFVVDHLHELYATPEAAEHCYYEIASPEWARQWPVEDLWVAHRAQ